MTRVLTNSCSAVSKPSDSPSPASDGGCHAHAYGYQYVNSYGGSSILELWSPTVTSPQVFSLSQQWFINTTGANGVQTIESGWQVYPQDLLEYVTQDAAARQRVAARRNG